MFDGRKLQFFCSREQSAATALMDVPFGLKMDIDRAFPEFEVACETDADCPAPDS